MINRLSQITKHLTGSTTLLRSGSRPSSPNTMSSINNNASPSSRMIRTAACLVIGDEVLGGKTVDTNSAFFAKYCFSLGIDLKRIEVIADDEDEIIEASRRMSKNYDFVVTSGGIGPTHDDITYPSLAKSFNVPLLKHEETFQRMKRLWKPRENEPVFNWDEPSAKLTAKLRMATFPTGPGCAVFYPSDELWVPIAIVNENVHILPGIPTLFQQMLTGLESHILPRIESSRRNFYRLMISTPLPESQIAEYLTSLQSKVKDKDVKVGSYPRWGKSHNTVTLVGRDQSYIESLVEEVEKGVMGVRIKVEGEDDSDNEETNGGV